VPQMLQGVSEEEVLEALSDPCWRLSTLYSIRTRDGAVIPFRPRPQQARSSISSTGKGAEESSS
jgi:hypothetical protein